MDVSPIGYLPRIIWDEYTRFCSRKAIDAKTSTSFEIFAAHLYLSLLRLDPSSAEDVITGGMDDSFIDAIIFVLNGRLITSRADLIAAEKQEGFDLQIHFVQIASGQHPRNEKLNKLVQGAISFLDASAKLPENKKILEKRELKKFVFESIEQKQGFLSPSISLTYLWPGTITRAISDLKESLEQTLKAQYPQWETSVNLISEEEIEAALRAKELSNSGTVALQRFIRAPDIPSVSATFLGYVSANELLRLVMEGEKPNYAVFFDNVRSFLGLTDTNKSIAATLRHPIESRRFILMNNGVVISAADFSIKDDKLNIVNYQVVNGCQTCTMLIRNRYNVDENVFLPAKIIICNDRDIVNQSIESTNRQNATPEFMLLSRHRYALRLESYFKGSFSDERIYFERRANQYEGGVSSGKIPGLRVIPLKPLLQAFAVLNRKPWQVYREGSQKLQDWVASEELLSSSHNLMVYHLIAMMIVQARELNGIEEWDAFPLRFHFYHIVFHLIRKKTGTAITPRSVDAEIREARAFVSRDSEIKVAHELLLAAFEDFRLDAPKATPSMAAQQARFIECVEKRIQSA